MFGGRRSAVVGIAALMLALTASVSLIWSTGGQRRSLAAAQARWESGAVEHYRIKVRMVGWGGCSQEAEVRRERVVTIISNTCRYFNPRTVSGIFTETARFLRAPEYGQGCRRGLPGRDCACYAPYNVQITYDPEFGYPREVLVTLARGYQPNRAHLDYWRYLLRNQREPTCGGPLEPPGRHLIVEAFEPLP